jgi:putative SOS response-associated peptidase YedK
VAQKAGRQAAVFHQRGGWWGAELRWSLDRWKNPETGEPVISCTIIVTDANELTRPIHDRMPVVLDKADVRRWLGGVAGIELLKPAAEDRLRMWPVSRRVNKTGTGDDDPTLLDEVAA